MACILWIQEFDTGVAELDRQHRRLIEIINDLFVAMRDGGGRPQIELTLDDLIRFGKAHFDFEEALMYRFHYPDTELHVALHREIAIRLASHLQAFRRGEPCLLELAEYLVDWLTRHALGPDRELGMFLNLHGIL